MDLDPGQRAHIEKLVGSHDYVLFMKGVRSGPQCGFSASVVDILDGYLRDYVTIDVLLDAEVREGVKVYSSWPTIPQLYVRGEFVGGADIVRELDDSGELAETLGVVATEMPAPDVTITAAAAQAVQAAMQDADGEDILRLRIDARYYNDLSLGPAEPGDVRIESGGVVLGLDRRSANRAHGLRIDFVEGPEGAGFKLDNPNAPPQVQDMSVQELAERLKKEPGLHLYDVRTPAEIATARIEGAKALDDETLTEIEALPRDTPIVFHCHHGGRSARAAAQILQLGFREVYNVVGGIDAWSQVVDPSVPRY